MSRSPDNDRKSASPETSGRYRVRKEWYPRCGLNYYLWIHGFVVRRVKSLGIWMIIPLPNRELRSKTRLEAIAEINGFKPK